MSESNKNKNELIVSKKALLFIMIIIIYFVLFFSATMSIMKNNPINDFIQPTNKVVHEVLPQGWAFYSKNPRDNTYNVVRTSSGDKAVQFPNANTLNYFGFSRYGRSQGVEVGRLISKIDKTIL